MHGHRPQELRRRGGAAIVYLIVALPAMLALASLAVDYARVSLARSELRVAADAAARAGAAALVGSGGATAVRPAAVAAAAHNKVDGEQVADAAVEVESVYWDAATRTYARPSAKPANAVKVTVHRTAARGNPVRLHFGGVIGVPTIDVRATSVVSASAQTPSAFVGLDGFKLHNNAFIGSYDSSTNTSPTQGSAGNAGSIGSNGTIEGKNNIRVQGDVVLGPDAEIVASKSITGTTRQLDASIEPPTLPPWDPKPNPGGVPQAYTAKGKTQLPGGTYYLTSLIVDGDLGFSAPATLIINGNVDINGSLTAYGKLPANLTIYQLGTGRQFGDGDDNGVDITANIVAPGSDFAVKNNATLRGAATFRTITALNNLDLYFDQALVLAGRALQIVQVQ